MCLYCFLYLILICMLYVVYLFVYGGLCLWLFVYGVLVSGGVLYEGFLLMVGYVFNIFVMY